ncbi:MAG: hypothetical protein ACKPKO_51305, partial [Candidatus Fonsibacter sp.]
PDKNTSLRTGALTKKTKNVSFTTNETLAESHHIIGKSFNNLKDTNDDLCQNVESVFLTSFKVKLEGNTWYDTCRCHDVHVFHWLVSLGYKSLVTDMSTPISGILFTH